MRRDSVPEARARERLAFRLIFMKWANYAFNERLARACNYLCVTPLKSALDSFP